jgi:hypothetical protein
MSGLLPRNPVYELKMAHLTLLHGDDDDDHDDVGFGCHEILQNSNFALAAASPNRTDMLAYRLIHVNRCFKFSQSDFDNIECRFRPASKRQVSRISMMVHDVITR